MSVGQLLAMKPKQRAKAIAALPEPVRVKLAHLASLGLKRELDQAAQYQEVLFELTKEEES